MDKKVKQPSCRLIFSRELYAREAVELAAYVFSEKADIQLSASGKDVAAEIFCAGPDLSSAGEFANEVLNQQCRLDLSAKNGKISNMIVTKALLSASGETEKKRGKK